MVYDRDIIVSSPFGSRNIILPRTLPGWSLWVKGAWAGPCKRNEQKQLVETQEGIEDNDECLVQVGASIAGGAKRIQLHNLGCITLTVCLTLCLHRAQPYPYL